MNAPRFNSPLTTLFNPMFEEMGAERYFDYAAERSSFHQRLSHCYRLGALAFVNWAGAVQPIAEIVGAPEPRLLVHGSWHGPEAPNRIDHCWVVLDGDRIWEPISGIIFNVDKFYSYTRGQINALHSPEEVHLNLTDTGHWGAWPERG